MQDSSNEELSPEGQSPKPQSKDAVALTRVFLRVQEILKLRQKQGLSIEGFGAISATGDGKVDVIDLIKLQEGLTGLDLSILEVGDVVWWQTHSGSQGYFAIETPAEKGRYAIGGIRVERSADEIDMGEGWVNGAKIGGMTKMNTILTGMPLEYHVRVEGHEFPKGVITSPVQQAGVIRREEINKTK